MRFRPGGFEKERELTVEFRRWKRRFIEDTASRVGFTRRGTRPHQPDGLQTYGAGFFETSSRARRAFCRS